MQNLDLIKCVGGIYTFFAYMYHILHIYICIRIVIAGLLAGGKRKRE
jgi:hypothetical protein